MWANEIEIVSIECRLWCKKSVEKEREKPSKNEQFEVDLVSKKESKPI